MLDALRNHDSPPLRPNRLAAGEAIDLPLRRRSARPERAMRWVLLGFWAAMGVALAVRVLGNG